MHGSKPLLSFVLLSSTSVLLISCATQQLPPQPVIPLLPGQIDYSNYSEATYSARLPTVVSYKEKVIVVDPQHYAWGAYSASGTLVRAGIATSGGNTCEDEPGSCRTTIGTYRIYSLGDGSCYSHQYPKPNGGGLMPYCMFFNKGQSLHGSPDNIVVENNISHGCVRMRISDAEWLRYNFAKVGTKVVVLPYN